MSLFNLLFLQECDAEKLYVYTQFNLLQSSRMLEHWNKICKGTIKNSYKMVGFLIIGIPKVSRKGS